MATHVLFPYRPSRRCDRALRAAASLADESDARLTVLVTIVNSDRGRRCCGIQGERWMALLREAAADDLEHARQALGDRPATRFETAAGYAFGDIVAAFARDHGCDLTVLAPSVLGALAGRRELRQLAVRA